MAYSTARWVLAGFRLDHLRPVLARRRVIVWIIPFGLPMRVMQTNAAALVIPATAMTQAYSFVQAGATELNLTNSNAADNRVVKLSDISGNDNDTSGFALGSIGQAGDTRRYVGILNGTDVGSPLTLDASITGEWKGFLAMQTANFSSAKAITLDVGFDGTVKYDCNQIGRFCCYSKWHICTLISR